MRTPRAHTPRAQLPDDETSRDVEPAETPDVQGAFPRLSAEQISALESAGTRRATHVGDVLFREGDLTCDFVVVVWGTVAIVEDYGGDEERVIGVHGPGRFLGELNLLTGEAVFFTAVVRQPGEVLVVPVERVRALALHDPAMGDLILRAYLLRRAMLIELGTGFKIVGSRYSADAQRLREFAARNRLPCHWIDLEEDAVAELLLRRLGVTPWQTPVVIWRGTEVLHNPTNAELAQLIGLPTTSGTPKSCDLLVVGAGPTGLAAAVYGASEGLETVVLEATATGGQAATSSRIENYLGFPAGISGAELAERSGLQARKFGARFAVPARATSLEAGEARYLVHLDDGTIVSGRTVLLATGVRYRHLDVPRLDHFERASVHYAATIAEARLCVGDPVVVVGGGNSGGQATVFLAQHVARVHLLVREADLSRNMSRYLADRIEQTPGVEVLCHTEVRELRGGDALEEVLVEDRNSGQRRTLPARALFVFIGAEPHTTWLAGQLALDQQGYIRTGGHTLLDGRPPAELETSWAGVFAAGDVRSGSVKRVASAVGEGAMAIRMVHDFLAAAHVTHA